VGESTCWEDWVQTREHQVRRCIDITTHTHTSRCVLTRKLPYLVPSSALFHDNFVVVCQSILHIVARVLDSRSVRVGFLVDEMALEDLR
jgi:hypothetical protein